MLGRVAANQPVNAERAVVVTVALGITLAPLNSTMIAVAQPRIIQEFGVPVGSAGWLVTLYLIAMAAAGPLAGKLGDRLGRRAFFLGGLAVFGLASLAASLATSFPALLALRTLQAAGGAAAFPNGAALVREVVAPERRGSAMGLVGAAAGLAAALGPLVGGLLAQSDWRAIFLANLPLCAAALAVGWWSVPVGRRRPGPPFDVPGALLLTLVLALTAWSLIAWSREPLVRLALPAAALLGILFVRLEARHPDPVLDPRLFRHPAFAAANAGVALSNLAMYVTLLVLPLLAGAAGREARVGLELALLSGASVALAPLGGRLADELGRRRPAVLGYALLAAGLLPLAVAPDAAGLRAAGLLVAGVGLGLSSAGVQAAATEAVPARVAGAAAGVFSTGRYLGSVLGSSLLAGLVSPGRPEGFAVVSWVVVTAASLAGLAATRLHDRPPPEPAAD